jgi:hypothetical protein
MSHRARRFRKTHHRLCPCGKPARYFSWCRGSWRFAPDHPYCVRCWQAEVDSARGRRLAPRRVVLAPPPPRRPTPPAAAIEVRIRQPEETVSEEAA